MELFSQISIHDLFENGLRHGCFHRHFVQKFASSHYWHDEIVIIVWAKNRKLASCYWKIYQTEIFRFFIVIFSHIKMLIFGHQGALRNFTKFTEKHLCQALCFFAGLRPATTITLDWKIIFLIPKYFVLFTFSTVKELKSQKTENSIFIYNTYKSWKNIIHFSWKLKIKND